MQQRKLLVLDVEGTIITGYDYNTELKDDKFPAIIDKKLRDVLKNFADSDFDIVLATGTSGDNLDYYRNEFITAGINTFLKKYSPDDHSDKDSKVDKLAKYAKEFNISDKQNIYFFDDAETNVESAKESGFHNSFRVTDQNTLLQQLDQLSDTLGLKKMSQFSSTANMFPPKQYDTKKEATSLPAPRSGHVNDETDYFPIFVTGVNGSGKTTLIKNLHSSVIVAKETSSWEINQYYDRLNKIVYLDMPFFDGYDRNYKEVGRREHLIRDLAYQVQQSKGVFIFVLDYNSLYGSRQSIQGLLDALKVLNEEMSSSPTLFVMTKAEESILSANVAKEAELVFRGQTQIAGITKKMSDPKNWVYADAIMLENTKKEIDTWLEAPRLLAKRIQRMHHAIASSSTAAIYHSTAHTQQNEAIKIKIQPLYDHANTYNKETQKYLDRVKPNDIAILNHLSAHQLSDCRDTATKKIAKIPVFLNGLLYDLQTLLDCKEHNGFRTIPFSTIDFCLHDIQPADAVHLKIQETIHILQERAQEEKFIAQAATFTASAERARKKNRACAIL